MKKGCIYTISLICLLTIFFLNIEVQPYAQIQGDSTHPNFTNSIPENTTPQVFSHATKCPDIFLPPQNISVTPVEENLHSARHLKHIHFDGDVYLQDAHTVHRNEFSSNTYIFGLTRSVDYYIFALRRIII